MWETLNTWMQTNATSAQTTLGWIAVFMLIIFGLGVLYYLIARAMIGVWPALYGPVSGDWVKSTAVVWLVGTAVFGAIYALIGTAIGSGGYTGLQ